MLQDLLPLLPHQLGTFALWIAMAGTCIGAGLWLSGARFSRSIITLLLVAIGALAGKSVPRWMGWSIDPMAMAVGGAMVLGASGYLLHRWWVGIGFGAVLATWSMAATWLILAHGTSWNWPPMDEFAAPWDYPGVVWSSLPPVMMQVLPWIAGAGMVSGVVFALMWPRVGIVLLYSMTGLSLLISMGLVSVQLQRPELLSLIPDQYVSQLLALGGLVGLGAGLQWWLGPASPGSGASAAGDES